MNARVYLSCEEQKPVLDQGGRKNHRAKNAFDRLSFGNEKLFSFSRIISLNRWTYGKRCDTLVLPMVIPGHSHNKKYNRRKT